MTDPKPKQSIELPGSVHLQIPTAPEVLAYSPKPGATPVEPTPKRKPTFAVFAGITATAMIVLIATATLYYQWWRADTPTAKIIVWGEDNWDGAIATVTGTGLPKEGLTGIISSANDLIVRFYVSGGTYKVTVNRDGKVLAQTINAATIQDKMIWWPFRAPPAATQMHKRK